MRRTIIISLLALSSCSVKATEPTTLPPLSLAPPSTSSTTTSTTTTTTTVAPTTTIDPLVIAFQEAVVNAQTIYPQCAEWLPLLLEVGGRLEDWGTWSRVLWTESRCIDGLEGNGSIGLAQIQWSVHKEWATEMGITREMMLTARPNLTFAVALQKASGWSPWAYLNKP